LAWLFVGAASVLVRRSWQDRPEGMRGQAWRRWCRMGQATGEAAREFRQRSLEVHPCYWLGVRHRLRPLLIWGMLGLIGVGWAGGWLKWGADWLEIEVLVLVIYVMQLGLKLALASEACQRLGPERRDGTLELLLSTPMTVREILTGQLLVLRRQFEGPVLTVLFLSVVVLMAGWVQPGGWSPEGWLWFGVVGVGTFLADLYTLAWVGLWVGLTARHGNRAAGATVGRVMVLPWLVWILLLLVLETNRARMGTGHGGSYLTLWLVVALANNALFLVWSHSRLHRDLRSIASERFGQGRQSWWTREDRAMDPAARVSVAQPSSVADG
jgi:hypothetical protein